MSLNINKNFGAISNGALTSLNAHQSAMGKAITRVSTGMRVNSPTDDVSAYLTSRKIKADSDGYTALYNGLQSGSAKLNAADSAVSSVLDILNAMKSKALEYQAVDKTDTDAVGGVSQEYSRLYTVLESALNVQYNGEKILEGSKSLSFYTSIYDDVELDAIGTFSSDAVKLSAISGNINITSGDGAKKYGTAQGGDSNTGTFSYAGMDFAVTSNTSLADGAGSGGAWLVYKASAASAPDKIDDENVVGLIGTKGIFWNADFKNKMLGGDTYTLDFTDGDSSLTMAEATGGYGKDNMVGYFKSGSADQLFINGKQYKFGGTIAAASGTSNVLTNTDNKVVGTFTYDKENKKVHLNIEGDSPGVIKANWSGIKEQITANSIKDLNDSDIIDNLKKAIDGVTNQQAKIGAAIGAMEYASSYLSSASNAQETAYTSITEADMAKEMTNYVKNNVLAQAAQSMIAQANQSMASVLNLLQ